MVGRFTLTFFVLICSTHLFAQSKLSGIVKDYKGAPIQGASVSLDNTLDGATTDSLGKFTFTTDEKGDQALVVSAVGFEEFMQYINVEQSSQPLVVELAINTNMLDRVTVTATSFGSADGTQKTVLDPLDVVTTAGAGADPIQAMQMLPGVQRTGTQTGMMVRGGDASEASIIVDGLILQNPFFSDAPGVQQRSRFNAFQFKGIAFSSGGYSARYGQAMSSVLEMNTLDLPEQSTVNFGVHMAGIYASANKKFHNDKMSLGASGNYTNLSPFYGIANTNFDFYNVPTGGGGSVNYVWNTDKGGVLKVMGNYSHSKMGIKLPNPFVPGQDMRFGVKNNNAYGQATFKQMFGEKFKWYTAASYSYNNDDTQWDTFPTLSREQRAQGRTELTWYFNSTMSLLAGTDWQHIEVKRTFDTLGGSFAENLIGGYLELDWSPIYWLALRPGLRLEHSGLLQTTTLAPRLAASAKLNRHSIISIAGGLFYQNADKQYLLQGYRPKQQLAAHYIANYMYTKNDRTLRIEGYHKSYTQLVREISGNAYDPNAYRFVYGAIDNSGHGYATGVELFWRDKKTIKNFDYWLSYSYINTERLYKNFPVAATPDFIANHNLSLIGKYWIEPWNVMISGTYSFASGKPYFNPATDKFLEDKTPNFHNVSLQAAHLRSFGKWFAVIYAGVDNVLNRKNVFGYRYSANGSERYPIYPALYRTVFVGVNISLTKFDKDEL
jgi:hypothetical protein